MAGDARYPVKFGRVRVGTTLTRPWPSVGGVRLR